MTDTRHKVATVDELQNGQMTKVTVGETDILLARLGDDFLATGAYCTHYGAPLEEGVLEQQSRCVVCPWHHSVFELETGDEVEPPGRDCLNTFEVTVEQGEVYVDVPEGASERRQPDFAARDESNDRHFVIVGGGAAGNMAVETLRRQGFDGRITVVSSDHHLPYDRPNLSKAYLAGEAEADWLPLRGEDFYQKIDVDVRLHQRAVGLDPEAHTLQLEDETLDYDKLLLATGGQPRQLDAPGVDLDNVFLLRTRSDCEAIIDRLDDASRAVIVGSSFIGMETAASLNSRGLEVSIASMESEPFERIFGAQVGRTFRALHREHGVDFHLETSLERINGDGGVEQVKLGNGTELEADLVLIGVGVEPATDFISSLTKTDDGGIQVDDHLQAAPDIYAAGDIARFPDPKTYRRVRIEHWRLAEQHGQTAARNMLGQQSAYDEVPFFWTRQYGQSFKYVGHADQWEDIVIEGDLDERDYLAYYLDGDDVLAAVGTRGHQLTRLHALMRHSEGPTTDEVLGGFEL